VSDREMQILTATSARLAEIIRCRDGPRAAPRQAQKPDSCGHLRNPPPVFQTPPACPRSPCGAILASRQLWRFLFRDARRSLWDVPNRDAPETGEDGHADLPRYQVNRLLCCNNVVGANPFLRCSWPKTFFFFIFYPLDPRLFKAGVIPEAQTLSEPLPYAGPAIIKFYLQRDALYVFDYGAPTSDGLPRASTERRNLFARACPICTRKEDDHVHGRAAEVEPKLRAEWTLTSGSSEHERN